jgi:PTS system N-acetylglucosamine-specific IIC component
LNRILIITGLHHILNNVAWFLVGHYGHATGDLNRFFAGDPSAGAFMSGFFPVMMFGLPAACLAMYHAAPRERRKETAGLLLSMSLTSFLTGVTEPIEFTFIFIAPLLYFVHAVLTGLAMVVMHLLGVRLGFTFSAGAIDYVLNYNLGSRGWMLIPVGLIYSALYYCLFRVCISVFKLATPGREPQAPAPVLNLGSAEGRGAAFARALGGAANLVSVDACTTRLRLRVADQTRVDEASLKALGARGFVRPDASTLQVVLGPIADQVAGEVRSALAAPAPVETHPPVETRVSSQTPGAAPEALAANLLLAMGGAANIDGVQQCSTRLRVGLRNEAAVNMQALGALDIRGAVIPERGVLHVIIGPSADRIKAALERALAPAKA